MFKKKTKLTIAYLHIDFQDNSPRFLAIMLRRAEDGGDLSLLRRAFLRTLWEVWWWLVCRPFRLFSLRRDLSDAAFCLLSLFAAAFSRLPYKWCIYAREGVVRSAPLVRSRRLSSNHNSSRIVIAEKKTAFFIGFPVELIQP